MHITTPKSYWNIRASLHILLNLCISNFPRTTPGWKQFERKSKFKSANNASPHQPIPKSTPPLGVLVGSVM